MAGRIALLLFVIAVSYILTPQVSGATWTSKDIDTLKSLGWYWQDKDYREEVPEQVDTLNPPDQLPTR